jgi:hypothetical protein
MKKYRVSIEVKVPQHVEFYGIEAANAKEAYGSSPCVGAVVRDAGFRARDLWAQSIRVGSSTLRSDVGQRPEKGHDLRRWVLTPLGMSLEDVRIAAAKMVGLLQRAKQRRARDVAGVASEARPIADLRLKWPAERGGRTLE